MGAPKIISQLPDLQLEWAKSYPNNSIRDFLINIKGFTIRQYKRILDQAPRSEWAIQREEIQNRITFESLECHIEEAKLVNKRFMSTAQVAVAVATKQMLRADINPKDLLSSISSVEKAQRIYGEALGLNRTWINVEVAPIPDMKRVTKSEPEYLKKLSYDDIIEFRRELKVKCTSHDLI